MKNKNLLKAGLLMLLTTMFFLMSNPVMSKGDSAYVKILSFSVKYVPASKAVNIHWITEEDRTGVQYIIERSLDSNTFRMIGYAKSNQDAEGKKDYYYYDSDPIGGVTYYRIREIPDTARQYVTPSERVSTPISQMSLVQLLLSKDNTELDFAIVSPDEANTEILIADVQGKIKSFFTLTLKRGANTRSVYTGNLAPGVYFLQVNNKDNGKSVMKQFIIPESSSDGLEEF